MGVTQQSSRQRPSARSGSVTSVTWTKLCATSLPKSVVHGYMPLPSLSSWRERKISSFSWWMLLPGEYSIPSSPTPSNVIAKGKRSIPLLGCQLEVTGHIFRATGPMVKMARGMCQRSSTWMQWVVGQLPSAQFHPLHREASLTMGSTLTITHPLSLSLPASCLLFPGQKCTCSLGIQ